MTSSSTKSCQPLNTQLVQNFHLVWLDRNIDETNDKWCNYIAQLREVVNTVNTFVDVDQCIDSITNMPEMVFIIMSKEFSEVVVSIISDMSQVQDVYIFCESISPQENWLKECPKVSGIHADIKSMCDEIKKAVQDYDHNTVLINFIKNSGIAKQNLDTLDCSFMYTQMLKRILLTLDFNEEHTKEFISYCREQFNGNFHELQKIDRIEKEYSSQKAIQWYTYQSFLYPMVNRGLRMMEVALIVKMGFFIRDLHNHINTLYLRQYNGTKPFKLF